MADLSFGSSGDLEAAAAEQADAAAADAASAPSGAAGSPPSRKAGADEYDLEDSCGSMGESGTRYYGGASDSEGGGAGSAGRKAPLRPHTAPGKREDSSALVAAASTAVVAAVAPPAPASARAATRESHGDESSDQDEAPAPAPAPLSSEKWASKGGSDSGSLLLARARAGSVQGVQLKSVDDLFNSDDDDDNAGGGGEPGRASESPSPGGAAGGGGGRLGPLSRLEEELLEVRREVAEMQRAASSGVPPHRSEHANVREEGAMLRWPPKQGDYHLEELDSRRALGLVGVDEEKRLARRGGAPDAQLLFDEELEERLTTLVMMMTLEAAAVGTV